MKKSIAVKRSFLAYFLLFIVFPIAVVSFYPFVFIRLAETFFLINEKIETHFLEKERFVLVETKDLFRGESDKILLKGTLGDLYLFKFGPTTDDCVFPELFSSRLAELAGLNVIKTYHIKIEINGKKTSGILSRFHPRLKDFDMDINNEHLDWFFLSKSLILDWILGTVVTDFLVDDKNHEIFRIDSDDIFRFDENDSFVELSKFFFDETRKPRDQKKLSAIFRDKICGEASFFPRFISLLHSGAIKNIKTLSFAGAEEKIGIAQCLERKNNFEKLSASYCSEKSYSFRNQIRTNWLVSREALAIVFKQIIRMVRILGYSSIKFFKSSLSPSNIRIVYSPGAAEFLYAEFDDEAFKGGNCNKIIDRLSEIQGLTQDPFEKIAAIYYKGILKHLNCNVKNYEDIRVFFPQMLNPSVDGFEVLYGENKKRLQLNSENQAVLSKEDLEELNSSVNAIRQAGERMR